MRVKARSKLLKGILQTWLKLRAHFGGRSQVTEAELLAFFDQVLSGVTTEAWPAVLKELVRSQLLYEVGPGLLSFDVVSAAPPFQPVVAPAWVEVWHYLKAHLTLPLGCLWSTQWLQPFLAGVPELLVVEVNWAELNWARGLLSDAARAHLDPVPAESQLGPASPRVVLRPWQRNAPIRRVKGIPIARLEKMLVDAGQLPELASVVSDATLPAALTALQRHYSLDRQLLLQYAAQCHVGARWEELLSAASNS